MADYLETYDPHSKTYKKQPKTFYQGITLARKYTYADYLTWGDDVRYELLDGVPYMMSSPNERHQWIILDIVQQLQNQLKDKPCVPYVAPLDVRLFHNEEKDKDETDTTVVQPDILVVCDEEKIKGLNYCKGPPNLVIEISSPSTEDIDFGKKRFLYEKAGIAEYWIVTQNRIYVYTLQDGFYSEEMFLLGESTQIEFRTLKNIFIDFSGAYRRYPTEDL